MLGNNETSDTFSVFQHVSVFKPLKVNSALCSQMKVKNNVSSQKVEIWSNKQWKYTNKVVQCSSKSSCTDRFGCRYLVVLPSEGLLMFVHSFPFIACRMEAFSSEAVSLVDAAACSFPLSASVCCVESICSGVSCLVVRFSCLMVILRSMMKQSQQIDKIEWTDKNTELILKSIMLKRSPPLYFNDSTFCSRWSLLFWSSELFSSFERSI